LTCYFRHLNKVFKKAGVKVTKENRQEIDKAIRNIIGVEYTNCPAAWREVKKKLAEDEKAFASALKKAMIKR